MGNDKDDYKSAYAEWLCYVNELAYDIRMSIATGLPIDVKNEMLLASLIDDSEVLSIALQQSNELRELCMLLSHDDVPEDIAWNICNVLKTKGC